ncbi:MAG: class I SAM-dependent methyltransferase [Thiomicrorhabdus sp.]|nr:class I SAM-dependent methyltransferase [Thiomicrorhabdus sp.]
MKIQVSEALDAMAKDYSQRVIDYGSTAVAVGWADFETQDLRFKQLQKVIDLSGGGFSLSDLGCGYAAFAQALPKEMQQKMRVYHGYDISKEMISVAKENFKNNETHQFFLSSDIQEKTDYVIASGIFNHHFDAEPKEWWAHIIKTIRHMYDRAEKGIAFNVMTSYVDYQEDYIYYCDPMEMLRVCLDHFGRNVSLHHDYNLFEFTVLVKKGNA